MKNTEVKLMCAKRRLAVAEAQIYGLTNRLAREKFESMPSMLFDKDGKRKYPKWSNQPRSVRKVFGALY